jgi:putative colanic acid biosynthesis acetyltransferase WcaF
MFGAKIGRGVHIYPRVEIWAPWNITAEDFAGVANGVTLYSMAEIHLGERCVVSQGAHLCTGSHDYNDPTFQLFANPIRVESRAWICAEAYLAPGVVITEGAVVGARSVVTRSLTEAWKVYAGVPARVIGERARIALPIR